MFGCCDCANPCGEVKAKQSSSNLASFRYLKKLEFYGYACKYLPTELIYEFIKSLYNFLYIMTQSSSDSYCTMHGRILPTYTRLDGRVGIGFCVFLLAVMFIAQIPFVAPFNTLGQEWSGATVSLIGHHMDITVTETYKYML